MPTDPYRLKEEPDFWALPALDEISGDLVFNTKQMDTFLDRAFASCRAEETTKEESVRSI